VEGSLSRGKGSKLPAGPERQTSNEGPEVAQVHGPDRALSQANSKLPAERILDVLRHSPSGLTAKEVAERLGAPVSHVGSRLSKLAAYGVIKKRRGRIASDAAPCAIYDLSIVTLTPVLPSAPE
jgi:DNA-binding transcriptional ArsR family regulator